MQSIPLGLRTMFAPGGAYIGGKERVTLELMSELQSRGWPILAVFSGWNDGLYSQLLRAANLPSLELKLGVLHMRRPDWTLATIANLPLAARKLRRAADEFKPDFFVHTTTKQFHLIKAILPSAVRHIFHVHDMNFAPVWNPFAARALAEVDGVICVSRFVASQFDNRVVGGPVQVVHNGLRVPQNLTQYRSENHEKKFEFGIIGQIIPRKMHETIISAVKILVDEDALINFKVNIYGDNKNHFSAVIRDKINREGVGQFFSWRGFCQDSEKMYSEIDAILAPALAEPFGTSVLEAGMHSLPAIVARSGGFEEMVEEGECGFLFEPDDPQQLARLMQNLSSDVGLARRLGIAAHDRFVRHFSVNRMAEEFGAVLRMSMDVGSGSSPSESKSK